VSWRIVLIKGVSMETLKSHYEQLLGLNSSWSVTNVSLNLAGKSVIISLEHGATGCNCPECGASCGLKDDAPERGWRHLDTMQFETIAV
jgi:transposase